MEKEKKIKISDYKGVAFIEVAEGAEITREDITWLLKEIKTKYKYPLELIVNRNNHYTVSGSARAEIFVFHASYKKIAFVVNNSEEFQKIEIEQESYLSEIRTEIFPTIEDAHKWILDVA